MIELKLVETNVLTRWPCDICGGCTDKVSILCEGDDSINGGTLRACETCLEAGQNEIDARLREHIERRDCYTGQLRALIGNVKVPSFAEYEAAYKAAEAAFCLATGLRPTEQK
jgi:hypothetical protein